MELSRRYETQLGLLAALEPPRFGMAVARVTILEVAAVAATGKNTASTLDTSIEAVSTRIAVGVAKSMSVTTTKAVLQRLAAESLEEQQASALMTDVQKYAETRDKLGENRTDLAVAVLPVALNAIALHHLAFFIVYEAFDIGTYFLSQSKASAPALKIKGSSPLSKLRKASIKNAIVCVGSIGLGAVGYSIGTLIQPGLGTSIAGLVGETVLYLW